MDSFWKEISRVCGPVSSRIRLILEEVGYIHSGLAQLGETEIAEIENAVRSFPKTSDRSEAEWQQLLGLRKPLKQFQFLLGERSLLKELGRCVREQGITKFCKKLLHKDSVSKPAPRVLEQEREAVRRKVVEYYEGKCSDQEYQHLLAFSSKLQSMQIRVSSDENGLKADLECPLCLTVSLIRQERSGSWKISNFTAHIRKHQSDLQLTTTTARAKKKRPNSRSDSSGPCNKLSRHIDDQPSDSFYSGDHADLCREDDQSNRQCVTVSNLVIEVCQQQKDLQWEEEQYLEEQQQLDAQQQFDEERQQLAEQQHLEDQHQFEEQEQDEEQQQLDALQQFDEERQQLAEQQHLEDQHQFEEQEQDEEQQQLDAQQQFNEERQQLAEQQHLEDQHQFEEQEQVEERQREEQQEELQWKDQPQDEHEQDEDQHQEDAENSLN